VEKSHCCWPCLRAGGRPKVPLKIRQLIREMSLANPLWGAPRIHGELLKLGIDIGQTGVAKYMARRRRRPPSQGWTPAIRIATKQGCALNRFRCRQVPPCETLLAVHSIRTCPDGTNGLEVPSLRRLAAPDARNTRSHRLQTLGSSSRPEGRTNRDRRTIAEREPGQNRPQTASHTGARSVGTRYRSRSPLARRFLPACSVTNHEPQLLCDS